MQYNYDIKLYWVKYQRSLQCYVLQPSDQQKGDQSNETVLVEFNSSIEISILNNQETIQ